MGMRLWHPVLADVPMHIQIGDHALIDEFGLREVAGQLDALRLRHLARNGELDLAGKLRVLAHLERLDIVPEPFAVAKCSGAFSGSITSEWTTPRLLEKVLARSSRSSRSREAER
jgi:hypothetical protein